MFDKKQPPQNGKTNSWLYDKLLVAIHKMLNWTLTKRVLQLAKPYKKLFFGCTFLALVLAVLGPLRPMLVQKAVDDYMLPGNWQGLQVMALALLALLVSETVCRYFFSYLTSFLGQSIIKDLRIKVFQHITNFRLRYFDNTPVGTSVTRSIGDVEAINEVFSQGLITIIADILTLITIISIMFYTDWQLTLVCLIPFPLILYSTYIFKERIKGAFQEVRNQVAQMNAFLQEHISGMSVVQVFAAEKREMDKFKAINQSHTKANIASIWYFSVFFPILEIILAASMGLLVWYGANSVLANKVSLGVLIAFIMYLNMLFRPLRMLADKFNTLQMGLVASERVFDLLDRRETIRNQGMVSAQNIKGDIDFKDVWFAYDEENMVLRGVSFHLESGKTLAIVGATGAGKSSIINILTRFYDIQQGVISIDGQPIEQYNLHSLRRNIGLVLQDVFLFTGTVLENITLRNPDISEQAVIEAAKLVGAHQFIVKLPNGYHYNVMERGATLSMGQRQLISFIRALLYNPRILILDEATANIDTETEQMVQYAVEKLVTNRTAIVIAHRLSTIQKAHQIMVLNKGKISEIGTHESLLQIPNGHYKKLYETQFAATQNNEIPPEFEELLETI